MFPIPFLHPTHIPLIVYACNTHLIPPSQPPAGVNYDISMGNSQTEWKLN